jgi:hypothetical protein
MGKSYLRHALTILVSLLGVSAIANDEPKPWITELGLVSNTTLRMHWIHQYEGYDTVKRVDAFRGGRFARTFQISGQPVFNKSKRFMALPNCWHGGCQTTIRILDLRALVELPAIRFDEERFFKVSWEDENHLRVVLRAMNEDQKTEIRCFAVRTDKPSNASLEPAGCAGGSAPGR